MRLELRLDVTEIARLGEPAAIALTVALPERGRLGDPAIVCFAKPGAGFSRSYFTHDLPGPARGAQADWHTARGWVFVAVDPLGVGDSTTHGGVSDRLDAITLADASHAAEQHVLGRLAAGTLHEGFPPVRDPIVLGLGHSMGGCLTVVQQARHGSYDAIAVLGFGAVRIARPTLADGASDFTQATRRVYFYDDIDTGFYRLSHEYAEHGEEIPPWASSTYPRGVLASIATPGVIAAEAAAVEVPVLVALGERDVVPDPDAEPGAYRSAASVDLYICPRMGHMHNFAGTRELLWQRIDAWANQSLLARLDGAARHEPRRYGRMTP